jgi:hypothetical protein
MLGIGDRSYDKAAKEATRREKKAVRREKKAVRRKSRERKTARREARTGAATKREAREGDASKSEAREGDASKSDSREGQRDALAADMSNSLSVPAIGDILAHSNIHLIGGSAFMLNACVSYVILTSVIFHADAIWQWWQATFPPSFAVCPKPLFSTLVSRGHAGDDKILIGQSSLLDSSTVLVAFIYMIVQTACIVDVAIAMMTWVISGTSGVVASRAAFKVLRDSIQPAVQTRLNGGKRRLSVSNTRLAIMLLEHGHVIMRSDAPDDVKDVVDASCVDVYGAIRSRRGAEKWMNKPMPIVMSVFTNTVLMLILVYAIAADRQARSIRRHFGTGSTINSQYLRAVGAKPAALHGKGIASLSDYINFFLYREAPSVNLSGLFTMLVDYAHAISPPPWLLAKTDDTSSPKEGNAGTGDVNWSKPWWQKEDIAEGNKHDLSWDSQLTAFSDLIHRMPLSVDVINWVQDVVSGVVMLLLRVITETVVSRSNFRLACYVSEDMEKNSRRQNADRLTCSIHADKLDACTLPCSAGNLDIRDIPPCDASQAYSWGMESMDPLTKRKKVQLVTSASTFLLTIVFKAIKVVSIFLWGMLSAPSPYVLIESLVTRQMIDSFYPTDLTRAFGRMIHGCSPFMAGCGRNRTNARGGWKASGLAVPKQCPIGCTAATPHDGLSEGSWYCPLTEEVMTYITKHTTDARAKTGGDACVLDRSSSMVYWMQIGIELVASVSDLLVCPALALRRATFKEKDPRAAWDEMVVQTIKDSGADQDVDRKVKHAIWWMPHITPEENDLLCSVANNPLQGHKEEKTGCSGNSDWRQRDLVTADNSSSVFVPAYILNAASYVHNTFMTGMEYIESISRILNRRCAGQAIRNSLAQTGAGAATIAGLYYASAPAALFLLLNVSAVLYAAWALIVETVCTIVALNVELVAAFVGLVLPSMAISPLRVMMMAFHGILDNVAGIVGGVNRLSFASWTVAMWMDVYKPGFHTHLVAALMSWPFGGSSRGVWGVWSSFSSLFVDGANDRSDERGSYAEQSSGRYMAVMAVWMGLQVRSRPDLFCRISSWFDMLTSSRVDRTPGYDAVGGAQKLLARFSAAGKRNTRAQSAQFIAGLNEQTASQAATDLAWDKNVRPDLDLAKMVVDKETYMGHGSDKCRLMQSSDIYSRSCPCITAIVSRQTRRTLCALTGESVA